MTTFKDKFGEDIVESSTELVEELAEAEAGFILIVNADKQTMFGRIHNMAGEDVAGLMSEFVSHTKSERFPIL